MTFFTSILPRCRRRFRDGLLVFPPFFMAPKSKGSLRIDDTHREKPSLVHLRSIVPLHPSYRTLPDEGCYTSSCPVSTSDLDFFYPFTRRTMISDSVWDWTLGFVTFIFFFFQPFYRWLTVIHRWSYRVSVWGGLCSIVVIPERMFKRSRQQGGAYHGEFFYLTSEIQGSLRCIRHEFIVLSPFNGRRWIR